MTRRRLVVIVMGVSASGKTTVGRKLARRLRWPFKEGDELHTRRAIRKMKSGRPLNDRDRAPWLARIARWIDARRRAGSGGVIACSALKRAHRDVLVGGRPDVRLLYLRGQERVIAGRANRRRGHFMPPALLHSQFETLEEPGADERPLVVDVDRRTPDAAVAAALEQVRDAARSGFSAPCAGGGSRRARRRRTDHCRSRVMHSEVLSFWFEEIDPKMWWAAEPAFDGLLRRRFASVHEQAARGELFGWRSSPKGRLAEILVLDQFSRNIHRDSPQAFSQDPMALALAQEAVAAGVPARLSPVERSFLLLPYMHSESKLIHVQAEALYRELAPRENYEFELRHKAIIDRFGRYPHRNEILGRVSSPEEKAFLEQPGSRF